MKLILPSLTFKITNGFIAKNKLSQIAVSWRKPADFFSRLGGPYVTIFRILQKNTAGTDCPSPARTDFQPEECGDSNSG